MALSPGQTHRHGPLKLRTRIEQWPLTAPFRITGHTWEQLDVLLVTLECNGHIGRGEAAGVYYKKDTPASMLRQLEALRSKVETGMSREELMRLLPPGGARNALDCALWDLEAKILARPVWQIAGIEQPHPVLTTFTCGADTPESMATLAAGKYKDARAIKLKLTGEGVDADRVRGVRAARPDVWLGVDANQGFTRASLDALMLTLIEARVSLIEQPFAVGQERLLDGYKSPIPIAADESVQGISDMAPIADRVQFVNIKLDKCGGLTEGLAMAKLAHDLGLSCMVGNMIGTSLAMAPGCVLGQLCRVADLDGPLFLKADRESPARYEDGFIDCPPELWGYQRGSEGG